MSATPIRHALLEALGVEHGFGVRNTAPRERVARVLQVHGAAVATVDAAGVVEPERADAIVTAHSRQCVGVVTADCVPILAASESGRAVAAIHAGWRGLAAGVVEQGLLALAAHARGERLVAVIGPHIGVCCYEIDEPVSEALRHRFGQRATEPALRMTRPGHALLELAALVEIELARAQIGEAGRARVEGCTRCDADRFHSYRRDGDQAGRLLHFIAPN